MMTKSTLTDEARAFFKKPLLARISTVDADGYPHTVPVWFDMDGEDFIFISERNTAKVRYAQANTSGAVTVGGDTGDGGGYLVKGALSVEEDPDRLWMKRVTYRYEDNEQAEKDIAAWMLLDMIIIRLKPERVLKV